MWNRNLLFWSVCLAGMAGLGTSLVARPARFAEPDADQVHADDNWRQVVAQLDESFENQWRQASLQPAPAAEPLMIARRLSLALMGTVPSLEEIRFLESEPREERFRQWFEHVLRDRRHHDYFAERLARAYVGIKEGAFIVYRRRRFVSWLSDQLAARRPYDAIVRDLIASDGLWTDQPATNFITVTIKPDQDDSQPNEHELAARLCRAMLGVRIDCAECHDHPYDHWKQKEFQGLAAFFAGTRIGFRGITDQPEQYQAENRKTGKLEPVPADVPFGRELLPQPRGKNDDPRQRLAEWVTAAGNKQFARATVNRVWALMFGRGLVQPVDDIRDDAPLPPALEQLADDFADHGFQLDRLIRIIAYSAPFHRDSRAGSESGAAELSDEHINTWAAFPLSRLRPEQVAGSVIQAASLTTLDQQAHLVFRLGRVFGENDFIKRYGDAGEDELTDVGGTIPQRLLMLNGNLVTDKTRQNPLLNAVTQIGLLSRDDRQAVETAYLATLTRRPTLAEREYFEAQLAERSRQRNQRLEDLYWTLLNSTEFSWNH